MRSIYKAVAGAAALAALLAGCSGSGGSTAATNPTATTVGSSTSRTGPSRLTKSEAVAAGDAVCQAVNAQLEQLPPPSAPADFEPYLRRLVAAYRSEITDLQGVSSRSDLAELDEMLTGLGAYIQLVDSNITELAKDPKQLNDPGSPYGVILNELQVKAKALGFRVCGATASSSTSATT